MNRNHTRPESGFSLVVVTVIGLIATLIMTAMFTTVVPSINGVTKSKTDGALKQAAESALEYAMSRVAASDPVYTPQVAGGQVNITLPPSNYTSSPLGNFAGIPINASVTVADAACPNNSYLYDFLVDTNNPASQVFGQANRWRVVTAVANIGGQQQTLRAIMKPVYNTVNTVVQQQVPTNQNGWPFRAIAAAGNFVGNGGITTNSYNSASEGWNPTSFRSENADVYANGSASAMAASSSIGGDLTAGNAACSGGTVTGSITSHAPLNTFPPVPDHPGTATPLNPLLTTHGRDGNGGNVTLQGGDYYITPSTDGGPAIHLTGVLSVPAGQTVRIWIEGSSPTVNLGGVNLGNGGNPINLQIYYHPSNPGTTAGENNISIGGNDQFKGVVYAPNTNVCMNGASSFYGSVVGNNVIFNGGGNAVGQGAGAGQFHYDESLNSAQLLQWTTTTTQNVNVQTQAFQQAHCVSWEHL